MKRWRTFVLVAVMASVAAGVRAQSVAWPWTAGTTGGEDYNYTDPLGNVWDFGNPYSFAMDDAIPTFSDWTANHRAMWDDASTLDYTSNGLPPNNPSARWAPPPPGGEGAACVIVPYPSGRPTIGAAAGFPIAYVIQVAEAGEYDITGVMSNYFGGETQLRIGAYDASGDNYVEVINKDVMAGGAGSTLDFDDPANDATVDIVAGGYLCIGFYDTDSSWQALVLDDMSLVRSGDDPHGALLILM